MTVRLVPVDSAAAELRVDLHVPRPVHRAPVADAGRLDAPENRVELRLRDAETEVMDGKVLLGIDEVKRQAVVYEDRRKRSNAGRRPFNAKQLAKQFCGSDSVA